jgi:GNAT superfamily N-acetyltransferase
MQQPTRWTLQAVRDEDFEPMVAIRIEAMRPSLERLGRFDPERARQRLRAGFEPAFMHHVVDEGGERVGFFTLKPEGEGVLRLDHLYLRPHVQGRGVGAGVLAWVIEQARTRGAALRVTALAQSEANRFYARHGFVREAEDELEVHYRRSATGVSA